MKIEDATKLFCPYNDYFCKAEKCMAWRTQIIHNADGFVVDKSEGFCRLITRLV